VNLVEILIGRLIDYKWVDEYQTSWLSNNTWRWANVQHVAILYRLKGQVCSLAYELAATWH